MLSNKSSRILLTVILFYALWSCANIGNPEGGPYDMTPPRLIKASPGINELGVSGQRLNLYFDEYIKLNNQSEKVLISPPQLKAPIISANGKSISIRLQDSLLPETTYSIYFDDAIVDNNEDNPLEDFAYTFSTGQTIDSMQLSGIVLDAETLEPIPSAIVGAYYASSFQDSTVAKEVAHFASRTNKMGEFTIRGLKDSTYRVFALQDIDNNYLYSLPTEGLAIDPLNHRTSLLDSIKTDTIRIDSIVRRDTLYRDSLVTMAHTYYYPDNIVLRHYTARKQPIGLDKYERTAPHLLRLEFLSRPDSLPELNSLDFPTKPTEQTYVATRSQNAIHYWLIDSTMISMDSLRFSLTYDKEDSIAIVKKQTDSLTFHKPRSRKAESQDKVPESLKITVSSAKGIVASTPADSLILSTNLPLQDLTKQSLRLTQLVDSIETELDFSISTLRDDDLSYHIEFPKVYGGKYKLHIDSAQLHSLYGQSSHMVDKELAIALEEDFGSLQITLMDVAPKSYVQLLDKSGNPLLTQAVPDSNEASEQSDSLATNKVQVTFSNLKPDEYYLRLYVDLDGDGLWSPGAFPSVEPEWMYYSPTTYSVKKSFTTAEEWSPTKLPLTEQKPKNLRKAKAEEPKKRVDKNIEYYKGQANKKKKRG